MVTVKTLESAAGQPVKPPPDATVLTKCLVGAAATNCLHGQVCLLTGGSRGIGKGICQELARNGAIVYVTGRSTASETTDILLAGSVDETAAALGRLGGVGVAVHADHAQVAHNKAVVKLLTEQHGRVDCLVNNAFFIPKPDLLFFNNNIWNQPSRFLNEQITVGGLNHAQMTMMLLSCLRRGKGLVVNISSWGSQMNIPIFPASYLVNKASFDNTTMALNAYLRQKYHICPIVLWPGSIRSERSVISSKRSGARLNDAESVRFTGRCVATLLDMPSEDLVRYTHNTTVVVADFMVDHMGGHDIDGYMQEKKLLPFWTGPMSGTWGAVQAVTSGYAKSPEAHMDS